LGPRISDYVYVDFASGAGGPTPYIEQILNKQLREEGKDEVKMVLSDLKPHIGAWEPLAKKSGNLSYIPQGIDAANCPNAETLLKDTTGAEGKKVMRLFSLAFHHFDDDLAAKILENTVETSDGFWYVPHHSAPVSAANVDFLQHIRAPVPPYLVLPPRFPHLASTDAPLTLLFLRLSRTSILHISRPSGPIRGCV
jgi:hypothetical protein